MTSRADIVKEARSWIGTPWRHQGRLKGVASDCIGVVIGTAKALGLTAPEFDIRDYARFPDGKLLRKYLGELMDPVSLSQKQGGDVLLIRPSRIDQHIAILTFENSIIHAIDMERGVREHILDRVWAKLVVGAYKFKGLDE